MTTTLEVIEFHLSEAERQIEDELGDDGYEALRHVRSAIRAVERIPDVANDASLDRTLRKIADSVDVIRENGLWPDQRS